jgi:Abortive infection C-terminus
MRAADFFTDVEVESPFSSYPEIHQCLDEDLLESLRTGPLPDKGDLSAAEGLLDLVQDELTAYGTDGRNELSDRQIALAIRVLGAVTDRLGVPLRLPFRNFTTFRTYWLHHEGQGSWQARREIVDRLLDPCRIDLAELEMHAGPKITAEAIASLRNATAIREHLDRLQRSAHNDPPLAIGTAKELVESTAKTVLLETGEVVDDRESLPSLVSRAQRALGLHPASARPGPDGTDAVKRILGGLMSITAGLGELRNRGYGTGHGPKGERVGLHPRHAHLAVNAAMTWCSIMLDTLADPAAPWRREPTSGEETSRSSTGSSAD